MIRLGFLDCLRGGAVVLMVFFHTCKAMVWMEMIDLNMSQSFWPAMPKIIIFTFLFCVGISLNFSHFPQINWNSLKKRSFKLALGAMAVSLSTYLIIPEKWVYFGTLHCILVGSILGALLVNHRRLAALILTLIVSLQYVGGYGIKWIHYSLLNKSSLDFIPIYPWLWVILLGILTGPYLLKNKYLVEMNAPVPLRFLGAHAFKIYVIQAPIIYPTLWVIRSLI